MAAMPEKHSKATIVSMAVLAEATATLLHEGVGHGITAWLRGAVPTELTSNHLSTLYPDRWVDAGGTLVNLGAGALALSLRVRQATGQTCATSAGCWLRRISLPAPATSCSRASAASATGSR